MTDTRGGESGTAPSVRRRVGGRRVERVSILASLLLTTASLPPLALSDEGAVVDDAEVARVLALSDDIAYGEYLAAECAACHAASASRADGDEDGDGGADADGAVPRIHGADAADLARALLEYRAGLRPNETMRNVAGVLGDEEVAVLARYLSSVER